MWELPDAPVQPIDQADVTIWEESYEAPSASTTRSG
jgi:hypothetical protein